MDIRSLTPAKAEVLCERIVATGALEAARAQALTLIATAKQQLPARADGVRRELLELVADAVVERYR